VFLNYFIYFL